MRITILFAIFAATCCGQCTLVLNPLSGQLNCGGSAAQFSDSGTTLSTTKNLSIATTVTTVSATSYTVQTADCAINKILSFTSASPVSVTVPATLAAGCAFALEQAGAGIVSVIGASGVTAKLYNGLLSTAGQNATATVYVKPAGCDGSNPTYTCFVLAGNLQ